LKVLVTNPFKESTTLNAFLRTRVRYYPKSRQGMSSKKRIACVRFTFLPLSETFVYEEIKNIRHFEPIILCINTRNLDRFPYKNIRSFPILSTPTKEFNKLFFKITRHNLLSVSSFFSRVVRSENVQLVRAYFGITGAMALFLKRKFGIPYVTSFHGYDTRQQLSWLYKELFKECDLFLVRSKQMMYDLKEMGCPIEKIRVHHSGVDVTKFKFHERKPVRKSEKVRVLFVGRFIEKKGVQYAIKAFAKTKKVHKNITLNIIGDGPLRTEIERLVQKLGLSAEIHLLGWRPHSEIASTMINSHILIQPSVTATNGDKESIPNVLIEAQATGMPVISTFHAGIPELVLDGKSGYLVKEREIDGLSEKLNILIENSGLWVEFGKTGRKLVEDEFNIHKQVAKLEKLYAEMIA